MKRIFRIIRDSVYGDRQRIVDVKGRYLKILMEHVRLPWGKYTVAITPRGAWQFRSHQEEVDFGPTGGGVANYTVWALYHRTVKGCCIIGP